MVRSLFRRKITMQSMLRRDGFRLMGKNSKHWERLAKEYGRGSSNNQFIKVLSKDGVEDIANRLRMRTDEILGQEYDESKKGLYNTVKRWCVVPISIEDRAKRLGFSFLDMEGIEDDEIWEIRVMYYRPRKGELDLSQYMDRSRNIKGRIKIMKELAKTMIRTMNYEEDGELKWKTSTGWFTKKRP